MTCFEFFMEVEYQIVTLTVRLWQQVHFLFWGFIKGKGEL
jgi:hypothetical protein